ncbi:MAG: hypothetical protein AAFX93_00510 [Verrucomicrobiota bacterium]
MKHVCCRPSGLLLIAAISIGAGYLLGLSLKRSESAVSGQDAYQYMDAIEEDAQSKLSPYNNLFAPKTFSAEEIWKWKAYDAFLEPEFSLTKGANWSSLRTMLDQDLYGTLDALVALDLGTAIDVISLPVYLGQYLSEFNFADAVTITERLQNDHYLFQTTIDELTVALTDQPNRVYEVKRYYQENPENPVIESSARLFGARLNELEGGVEAALNYATTLPPGTTRGQLIEGAIIPWIDSNPAQAEAYLNSIGNASSGELNGSHSMVAMSYSSTGNYRQGLQVAENIPESQDRYNGIYAVVWDWAENDSSSLHSFAQEPTNAIDEQTKIIIQYVFEDQFETRKSLP